MSIAHAPNPLIRKLRYYLLGGAVIRSFTNWQLVLFKFLKLLPGDQTVSLKLKRGGTFYIKHFLDALTIIEIWGDDAYKIKNVKNPKTIIDIGANIGAFTIKAAQAFPKATIISFEPSIETYNILTRNLIENKIKNVKSFNQAVAKKNGQSFLYDPGPSGLRSLHNSRGSSKKITVKTLSLNKVISDLKINKCDFLKIDCEGAEYEIIYNLKPANLKKIKFMSLEFHDGIQGNHEDLIKFLNKQGFKTSHVHHPLESDIGIIYSKHV